MNHDRTTGPGLRDEPMPAVPWTWREMLLGTFVVILVILAALFAAQPLVDWAGKDSPESRAIVLVTLLAAEATAGVLVYVLFLRHLAVGLEHVGLRQATAIQSAASKAWPTLVAIGLAGCIGFLTILFAYTALIQALGLDFLKPRDDQFDDLHFANWWIVLLVGCAVLGGAPLLEELFFRAFLYRGLTRYMPLVVAGLLSGFLFSLAHGDPGVIIPFTLIGGMLAWIFQQTGSILAPMAAHFFYNLIGFVVLVATKT